MALSSFHFFGTTANVWTSQTYGVHNKVRENCFSPQKPPPQKKNDDQVFYGYFRRAITGVTNPMRRIVSSGVFALHEVLPRGRKPKPASLRGGGGGRGRGRGRRKRRRRRRPARDARRSTRAFAPRRRDAAQLGSRHLIATTDAFAFVRGFTLAEDAVSVAAKDERCSRLPRMTDVPR